MRNSGKMPDLRHDQIHVWKASLDVCDERFDQLRAMLSSDEIERARRYHAELDARRFIVGRGLLRELVGHHASAPPHALSFGYNEYGKPALLGDNSALCLNLSHSGQLAVFAIAKAREVGVDIEEHLPARADMRIAQEFFSPREVTDLSALPEALQTRAFFNCWTRKEAYIKARGGGLSIPLDSFDVSLVPGQPAALLRTAEAGDLGRWRLCELDLGSRYVGALAAFGTDWRAIEHRGDLSSAG